MKYDLGFANGLVMMFMLNCAAAVEVIQHGDITLKEVAQSGSPQADDGTPQLEAWTVKSCSSGLDCSTFLRTQIRVSTKAKTVKIQCFEPSTSTDTAKSLNLKKIRNMTRTDPRHNLRTVWEIIYDCIEADPGQTVFVTVTADYKRSESQKSVRQYRMEDGEVFTRVPNFNVTVDGQSRSLTVSVPEGPNVKTRLCYKQTNDCAELNPPVFHIINTTHSLSANLSFPYQLPCVCVEVYFTGPDAVRTKRCPFENNSLGGSRDIWISSSVEMYGDQSLVWKPVCDTASLMPSASLCWRLKEISSPCLPVANSTLQVQDQRINVSTVDQHPLMCVQLSLNGTHDVRCPFQLGDSEWHAVILPAAWHFHVHLTTSIPASFSAQLCVLEGDQCVARGTVHSVTSKNSTRAEMRLPYSMLSEGLCVQVWRSAPAVIGKRLMCPLYSHGRSGLIVMAAVVVVLSLVTLAYLVYQCVRKGLSDWQLRQKPVLLVCSSELAPQVSAVCALASLLQGELCAGVRMALWAQNTGGVAKLGPLPWLYGQCEVVRGAGGKVLIAWSPEAMEAYRSWGRAEEVCGEEKEKDEGLEGEESGSVHADEKGVQSRVCGQKEPSSVTAPILRATLSCLQGALQGGRHGHGFALVYFKGLCHSRDIPPELRAVPRYCLPQDFGGLVQELQGAAVCGAQRGGCQCWTGLLSKILALRLAQRLKAWLPQAHPLEEEVKLPWETHRREGSKGPLTGRTEQSVRWEKESLTKSALT